MLVRIDSFHGDKLISGKVASTWQLKFKMQKVLADVDESDFVSIFCARYGFDCYPYDDKIQVDYVTDLDTHLVYQPVY